MASRWVGAYSKSILRINKCIGVAARVRTTDQAALLTFDHSSSSYLGLTGHRPLQNWQTYKLMHLNWTDSILMI